MRIPVPPAGVHLLAGAVLLAALAGSTAVSAAPPSTFTRGDSNGDGAVNVSDAIESLGYLFQGADLECADAADSNDDGDIDVSDPIHTLAFLFLGTVDIPEPGHDSCGPDPTEDDLVCSISACARAIIGEEFDARTIAVPPDQRARFEESAQAGQLEAALDRVLNSAGDTVELDLEVSLSIAVVAALNGNGKVGLKPQLTLTTDGAYEVAIERSAAGGVGVELYEGVEANARLGTEIKVVIRVGDLAEVVRAINDMALANIVEPLRAGLENAIGAVADAAGALDTALEDLSGHLATEQRLRDRLDSFNASLRGLTGRIDDLVSELGGIASRLAGATCGSPLLPAAIRTLCNRKAEIEALLASLDRQRRNLIQQITDTENQLAAAAIAVSAARMAVQTAERALEAAESLAAASELLIQQLIGAQDNLNAHLAAFEFKFGGTQDIEAKLSPIPGVSAAGTTVGASLEGEVAFSGRLDLEPGPGIVPVPAAFTLSKSARVKVGGKGAVVEGEVFVQIAHTQTYDADNGFFDRVDEAIELTLDAQAQVVAGVGILVRRGAGYRVALAMEVGQVLDRLDTIASGLVMADVEPLVDALLAVEATITHGGRRTSGAGLDVSISYVGYGGGIKGIGNWIDGGEVRVVTLSAGGVLERILDATEIDTLLDKLIADAD